MKYLKEIAAALVFAILYFVTDQYWLHKDRTVGRNVRTAVIVTICFFVVVPLIRKWIKSDKANVSKE